MASPATRDDSGIRFPPPFIYALFFLAGYGLHRLEPVALFGGRSWPDTVGLVMIVLGVALAITAAATFRRAGTNVNPTKPATTVVTHGPFRFTRNPMYLSMAVMYLGGVLMLDSVWPLVLFPVTIWVIRTRIIALEEAYLEAKFGAAYNDYKKKVRRWL
ncbi:MAG TPA: isoprenylcysteine carboxylmethyltransferase family protein [Gemmatimonadales bacterium]|jgi:protein-S-isoprenylcysteine O-methyltransferase Ste14|nr:isoprenylcysteine carboxylmethyltransferase family protein [Gemmatimonadales bacterium]